MEFIEAPAFTRHVPEYLDDDQFRDLQDALSRDPESGDLIAGTGGFRKLRWADKRRSKGRRGGLRIIYYFFPAQKQIWFVTLYGKNEAGDLSQKEKKTLKDAILAELRARRL